MPNFSYLDEATDVRDDSMSSVGSSQGGKLSSRPQHKLGEANYKAGTVQHSSAALMIPPGVQAKLSTISNVYGLPFDIGAMSLEIATPDNLNSLRNIVDMYSRNSKLLPEILQLVKKLMKADIKLAEYHEGVTKAAIKHGESIDKATANIFTMMSKAAVKSAKLTEKTNRRHELREKRFQSWSKYYQDSVLTGEMEVIQTEFDTLASNELLRRQSRKHKTEFNAKRQDDDVKFDMAAHQHNDSGGGSDLGDTPKTPKTPKTPRNKK